MKVATGPRMKERCLDIRDVNSSRREVQLNEFGTGAPFLEFMISELETFSEQESYLKLSYFWNFSLFHVIFHF
jgi:hypothetical protein